MPEFTGSLGTALEAAKLRANANVKSSEIFSAAKKKRGLFSTLGSIGGAIGGFFIGGPAGASVGASLGGSLGGAVSGTNPALGNGQQASTLQSAASLGSQLSNSGFYAPPNPDIPSLGSSLIQPIQGFDLNNFSTRALA